MTASSISSNGLQEEHDSMDAIDWVDPEKEPPPAETSGAIQKLEWNGPEDPENPLNWSSAKKAYHAAIPSIYCYTMCVGQIFVRRILLMRD